MNLRTGDTRVYNFNQHHLELMELTDLDPIADFPFPNPEFASVRWIHVGTIGGWLPCGWLWETGCRGFGAGGVRCRRTYCRRLQNGLGWYSDDMWLVHNG